MSNKLFPQFSKKEWYEVYVIGLTALPVIFFLVLYNVISGRFTEQLSTYNLSENVTRFISITLLVVLFSAITFIYKAYAAQPKITWGFILVIWLLFTIYTSFDYYSSLTQASSRIFFPLLSIFYVFITAVNKNYIFANTQELRNQTIVGILTKADKGAQK